MSISFTDCSGDPQDQLAEALRAVQNQISWADREIFAREIAKVRRSQFPNVFNGSRSQELLSQFKARGHCDPPFEIGEATCNDVIAYFSAMPCYNHHVDLNHDGIARSVEDTAKIAIYGSYKIEHNLKAPHILEIALHPALLDLAGGYLECIPSIYSINTFWSFPSKDVGNTQTFHYDQDDFRFVTLFIYWTGIEKNEGEVYFVEGTHDLQEVEKRIRNTHWARITSRALRAVKNADDFRRLTRNRRNKTLSRLFPNEMVCVTGSPGRAVFIDTHGIHRGSLPRSKPRLCTWVRYGLYANWGYGCIKSAPVPASIVDGRIPKDDVTKFITRLILNWNDG